MNKLSIDDYLNLATKIGGKFSGGVIPLTSTHKTKWECKNGHIWIISYNDIKLGRNCTICINRVYKNIDHYNKLAASKKIIWLGKDLPKNSQTPTQWLCECGEIRISSFKNVNSNKKCQNCAGNKRKIEKDYIALCKNMALKWIGEISPKNNRTKTWWICTKCNFQFKMAYDSVKSGQRCPRCVRHLRKTEIEYRLIAQERGFLWKGLELPQNVQNKTIWECNKGHIWTTSYSSIAYARSGCSECNGVGKNEKECRDIFESLLGVKFKKTRPDFLKNELTGRNLELDGYNEYLKLAFEYDGAQHFKVKDLWGGTKALLKIHELDLIKNKKCIENNIILIRIPYTCIKKNDYIKNMLIKFGFL